MAGEHSITAVIQEKSRAKTIATENAPAAIGLIRSGADLASMVITSGQIPVDPKTGAASEDVSASGRASRWKTYKLSL